MAAITNTTEEEKTVVSSPSSVTAAKKTGAKKTKAKSSVKSVKKTARKKVSKKKTVAKKAKKSPSKKEEESKKVFYVGVSDPRSKQRELLQITADYLRLLQNIEKFNATRVRKKELVTQFQKEMAIIRSDAAKIYKLLPKFNLPHKAKKAATPAPVEEMVDDHVKKTKVKTEIDSLEAELAAIEGRLGNI